MEQFRELISNIEQRFDMKIPEAVVNILYETGFETEDDLVNFRKYNLYFIEEYIDSNCQEIIESSFGYEAEQEFVLKPDHEEIILKISASLRKGKSL